MDVRSRDFSRYKRKILRAVGSFYLFYGAEMSMKHLIYGMYRDVFGSVDFAPVIAEELLCGNEEVVQYCKDVLTSENNIAVITRDVIVAIEQSHNKELQQMLTQVLLAAKLQEGLRQSILETVDENNLEYFLEMTEVIERENLLRFSSVQRAVMTWIGLGYEEVKEKEIRYVFERIRLYFQDEEARGSALREAVNPLEVYLALYCKGVRDVEEAMQEACALLEDKRRYVVASALIYMKLTRCFSVKKYLDFPEKFRDDEWILALYFSECVRTDCGKCGMSASEAHRLYDYIEAFLPLAKSRKIWASKGFEWFSLTLGREGLCYSMFEILDAYPGEDIVERFLPYVASNLSGKRLDWFMENYFCLASEKARKEFMVKEIISSDDALSAWIEKEYKKIVLTEEDIVRLEERLKTKKAAARAHIVNVLADQGKESVKASYSRLIDSSVKTIRESAVELKNKTLQYWKDDVVRQTEILGRESGFGIYERSQIYELPVLNFLPVKKKGFFRKRETVDISFCLPWKKEQVLTYLRKWNARLTWHENEEYYDGSGYHQVKERRFFPIDYKKRTLDAMPLGELWRRYFEEDALTDEEVFEIRFLTETIRDDVYWERVLKGTEGLFTLSMDDVKELSYYSHFSRLLEYYFMEREVVADYAEKAAGFLQLIMQYSKERTYWKKESYNNEETYVEYSLSGNRSFWFMEERLGLNGADEKNFRRYFPVIFQIYQHFAVETGGSVRNKMKISPLVLARAAQLEMIPRSVLYEGILDDHMEAEKKRYYRGSQGQLFEAYRDAYYEGRGIWGRPHLDMEKYQHMRYQYGREVYEYLRAALDMIADRLLCMEAQRLNEKTVVTEYVRRLSVIRGAKYLMLALRVLEGENLRRQNSNGDRAEVFSDVIRNCYPSPGDDLKGCLEEGISRERLVEVAMLAPQWIDLSLIHI